MAQQKMKYSKSSLLSRLKHRIKLFFLRPKWALKKKQDIIQIAESVDVVARIKNELANLHAKRLVVSRRDPTSFLVKDLEEKIELLESLIGRD